MTYDPNAKLPMPVEVLEIDFRKKKDLDTHVVLEFRTGLNPIRVFLTKQQLEELAVKAQIAATKLV